MINKEIRKLLLYVLFDDLFKVYYKNKIIGCENYYYGILDIDHLIYDQVNLIMKLNFDKIKIFEIMITNNLK